MASIGSSRDWASLPPDIVASISERLYTVDRIQLTAVCSSWCSAAKSSPSSLAPRMPYLLIPTDHGAAALLNLSSSNEDEGEDHLIHRISPPPELRGKWLVGSQFGWLVTLDRFFNLILLDPVNRSQIHLPSITTSPYIEPVYDDSDGSLKSYLFYEDLFMFDPMELPVDYPLDAFHLISMRKVVLSSDPRRSSSGGGGGGYAAVAIFGLFRSMFYMRPGEEKWSFLGERENFEDVIYHDGRFIALASDGHIASIDLNFDPPKMTSLSYECQGRFGLSYLTVDSSGDLLQVCHCVERIRKHMTDIPKFEIVRFEPEERTWSPVSSLGEQSLFVGNCYSLTLDARDIPGLKTNCIYFTDNDWNHFTDEAKGMERDVGIFDLKDGSVERFNPPYDLQLKWPPPVFISPTVRWN